MWAKIENGKLQVEKEPLPAFQDMQRYVGGYVQQVPFIELTSGRKTVIICNEEGKLLELAPNFYVPLLDTTIVGNAIIIGFDPHRAAYTHLSNGDLSQLTLYQRANDIPALLANISVSENR